MKCLINVLVRSVLCVGLVGFVAAAEPTQDTLPTVRKNLLEKKAVLVDVREKAEWDKGRLAEAVFLPLSELRNGITEELLAKRLPKGKIVYTHCAAGVRSCTAADILQKYGYDVRPLKPGYKDLLEAGFKQAME